MASLPSNARAGGNTSATPLADGRTLSLVGDKCVLRLAVPKDDRIVRYSLPKERSDGVAYCTPRREYGVINQSSTDLKRPACLAGSEADNNQYLQELSACQAGSSTKHSSTLSNHPARLAF